MYVGITTRSIYRQMYVHTQHAFVFINNLNPTKTLTPLVSSPEAKRKKSNGLRKKKNLENVWTRSPDGFITFPLMVER